MLTALVPPAEWTYMEAPVTDSSSTAACSVHGSTLVATVLLPELRDTDAIGQLKDDLLAALAAAKSRNVILDLSQVKFIGSMGFLVFLRVRREEGVERIVLCNVGEQIREAFMICRLLPSEKHQSAPFEEAGTVQAAMKKCGEA